jgi:ABC-type transport system involved in multi-copper enzyme maturation permease subunit
MVGPVLYLEMLLAGRRGKQYVFRWIYAGWLVVQLLFLFAGYWLAMRLSWRMMMGGRPDPDASSRFAGSYIELFVVQQLILILLATPAFIAGAVTDEKTRGTLQHLLTADVTAWELVVGKLLGRMAQVAVLTLAGLPVVCFIGVFGGLDPVLLLAVAAVTLIPLFALAAASLLASVWSRQTRDAVLGLYAVGAAAFCGGWLAERWYDTLASATPSGGAAGSGVGILDVLHAVMQPYRPLWVLQPAWGENDLAELGRRLLLAALAWGGLGLGCLMMAGWRLRPAYVRQMEAGGRRSRRWLGWWAARRRPVASEPLRWKERQVEGIAPLPFLRAIPGWLGITAVFVLTVVSSGAILVSNLPPTVSAADLWRRAASLDWMGVVQILSQIGPAGPDFWWQGLVVMLVASLVVGIRCSGAVSGERERQTWEALLLTPLETRELIRGKLWGIIGASYPYLLAYAVPAGLLSLLGGPGAVAWTLIWLGVTWLATYYIGAAGLWCSTRSRSSWRSLLGTLGFGYVGGFILFAATTPIIFIVAWIIVLILAVIDQWLRLGMARTAMGIFSSYLTVFKVAMCLVLAGMFYTVAKFFLAAAEKRVADRERTRAWKDEPVYRPRRRRRPARPRYYK